ncbi:MAG: type II toxin-antitoxin system PemK/MazF family toxin [Aphanocapsa sp. GSE-SYN-MK-11-07L]|jgi:mRNA interferase MazF|nr:type II toxin-antitoxin system PemK/MazF family toxin [Aphanocapsa sp. GSE-SYN-MK-11-07L]
MATFVKGDIVVVPFPFSDLTNAKRRPALVVATLTRNDLILCLITSQTTNDQYAVAISNNDFETGSLNRNSYVKSNRLFTANEQIIAYKVGNLTTDKINEVITKIIEILQQ